MHDPVSGDLDEAELAALVERVAADPERWAHLVEHRPDARTYEQLHRDDHGFTASDIHRVSHAGTEPAVTVHAYSPPLWRMGAYEISPGGTLRRHSVSYAEELRPLADDTAAAA